MYIKVIDGVPSEYTVRQLRKDNPDVSFPRELPADVMLEYGLERGEEGVKPVADVVTEAGFTKVGDVWVKQYNSRAFTDVEKRQNLPAVSARQARLALARSGKLGQVKQAMNQVTEEEQIEWEYATEFVRTYGPLVSMATAMGFTEQEIDDLFELARSL